MLQLRLHLLHLWAKMKNIKLNIGILSLLSPIFLLGALCEVKEGFSVKLNGSYESKETIDSEILNINSSMKHIKKLNTIHLVSSLKYSMGTVNDEYTKKYYYGSFLIKNDFVYTKVSLSRDSINNIDSKLKIGGGFLQALFKSESVCIKVREGMQYISVRGEGTDLDEPVLKIGLSSLLKWNTNKLIASIDYDFGETYEETKAELKSKTKITDNLSFNIIGKYSNDLLNNYVDSSLTTGLEYKF